MTQSPAREHLQFSRMTAYTCRFSSSTLVEPGLPVAISPLHVIAEVSMREQRIGRKYTRAIIIRGQPSLNKRFPVCESVRTQAIYMIVRDTKRTEVLRCKEFSQVVHKTRLTIDAGAEHIAHECFAAFQRELHGVEQSARRERQSHRGG
jgi:hypothetical protein